MTERFSAPIAIAKLVQLSNEKLNKFATELSADIDAANKEILTIMGLNPNEWMFSPTELVFVRKASPQPTDQQKESDPSAV